MSTGNKMSRYFSVENIQKINRFLVNFSLITTYHDNNLCTHLFISSTVFFSKQNKIGSFKHFSKYTREIKNNALVFKLSKIYPHCNMFLSHLMGLINCDHIFYTTYFFIYLKTFVDETMVILTIENKDYTSIHLRTQDSGMIIVY